MLTNKLNLSFLCVTNKLPEITLKVPEKKYPMDKILKHITQSRYFFPYTRIIIGLAKTHKTNAIIKFNTTNHFNN